MESGVRHDGRQTCPHTGREYRGSTTSRAEHLVKALEFLSVSGTAPLSPARNTTFGQDAVRPREETWDGEVGSRPTDIRPVGESSKKSTMVIDFSHLKAAR